MKLNIYMQIAIRIIILFSMGMFFTYVPNELRDFFNDTQCIENCYGFDSDWYWGTRHYWFFWMSFFLFILSMVSFIMHIVKIIEKE